MNEQVSLNEVHRVHELYRGMQADAGGMVSKAIQIGHVLLRQKERAAHGEWGAWCQSHYPSISPRQIHRFILMARNEGRVIGGEGVESIRGAMRIIEGEEQPGGHKVKERASAVRNRLARINQMRAYITKAVRSAGPRGVATLKVETRGLYQELRQIHENK